MSKRELNRNDDETDQDLRNLLQKYIERSQELEKRESQVMKQIETMQSAVTSLQNWNAARKSSGTNPDPERLDLDEIEQETNKIREETMRIQKEVEEKIEENKILQAEVDRRRSLRGEASASPNNQSQSQATKSYPSRETIQGGSFLDMGIGFFQEKLLKLKGVEKKVKNESELQKQKNRQTRKSLEDKLEILELESKIDKQIINSMQDKKKDKK